MIRTPLTPECVGVLGTINRVATATSMNRVVTTKDVDGLAPLPTVYRVVSISSATLADPTPAGFRHRKARAEQENHHAHYRYPYQSPHVFVSFLSEARKNN